MTFMSFIYVKIKKLKYDVIVIKKNNFFFKKLYYFLPHYLYLILNKLNVLNCFSIL